MPRAHRHREANNPFIHARALRPEESIPRVESTRLLELAAGGHNTVLHAPRRFGKTTALKQLLAAAEGRGLIGVMIDLSDILSVTDVAARLEQALRALPGDLRRLISKELGGVSINVAIAGVSISRRTPSPDPIAAVHTLLELPAEIARRRKGRVIVVFDEFQALVALKGLDGVFRSHIQHHSEVSYVFAGSEPSMLRALFEDRARPLYGQAERLRLEQLDVAPAHDFIAARFSATGKSAGDAAIELVLAADGHPQRLMLLAHVLWNRVPADGEATITDVRGAYNEALRMVDPELRYLWDSLTPNERRVLAALASSFSPFQREAQALTGLSTRSSAARAIQTLETKAIIERTEEDNLRILDPLLSGWVRRHGGARLQIYVLPFAGRWVVTDGPALTFIRSEHDTPAEAGAEADRIAATGKGADVMVFDTDDPNDLPDWALPTT